MKKGIFIFFISLFIYCPKIQANELIEVKLDKCVDGDTAWFIYQDKPQKFRFLAINTPESTNKIEKYGKEASSFTCNELKKAKQIKIEFDINSSEKDKYGRYLAWIFIDDKLLQEEIIKNGYGKVAYLYGNYKYTERLIKVEKEAKKKKIRIFNDNNTIRHNEIMFYVVIIVIFLITCIFSKKRRKKIINKIKRKAKKEIKKNFN